MVNVCGPSYQVPSSACCTYDQVATLSDRLQQAAPLIASCPACVNNFPETVTVLQESKSTEIDFLNRQETYAKGIGLIRREQTELYYCQSANCFGQKKIEFGTRFIQQISSYGKE